MASRIDPELLWLALHKAFTVDETPLRKIGHACDGDIHHVLDLGDPELETLLGDSKATALAALSEAESAAQDWAALRNRGVEVVPFTDHRYPAKLRSLPEFPPLLYVLGDPSLLNESSIGICGSRRAGDESLKFARAFGGFAAERSLPVVSGLARGVDTESLLGALNQGGRSVGVLAEGITRYRMRKTLGAIENLSEKVSLVSQFYPKASWRVWRAMARNGIICGLSEALFVVEAGATGGTLAAGRECLAQDKPLYVVERARSEDMAPGNRLLIEEGGTALRRTEEVQAALDSVSSTTESARGTRSSSAVRSRRSAVDGRQTTMRL